MRHSPLRLPTFRLAAALLFVCALAGQRAAAQSGDVSYPTPIFSNEVTGRVAPRDVGDPRRTRHFYTFRGTEGDLLVTIESAELNGAVDVFTATGLRPLLNFTLYGGPTLATKSVYLRRDETLILRVEARAAGDAEGTYRIKLGGVFAPAPPDLASAPAPAAPEVSAETRRGGGVRRVTSTGARIEEPAPPKEEAAAQPTPTPAAESAAAPARREAPRGRRGRAPAPTNRRRGRTETPAPAEVAKEPAPAPKTGDTTTADAPSETKAAEATPPARAARGTRRNRPRTPTRSRPGETESATGATTTPAPDAAAAAPTPAPEAPGQRLIIVTKDGETVERDMRTVRRVTVENNQLVVVGRDGKTTRRPMSSVVRMAIEPEQ